MIGSGDTSEGSRLAELLNYISSAEDVIGDIEESDMRADSINDISNEVLEDGWDENDAVVSNSQLFECFHTVEHNGKQIASRIKQYSEGLVPQK